jgi:methionyl-tRNA synthetase
MSNAFYITTPIYYVNDEPHLGHAYTTILGDVLARYARLRGDETFFLTGVDEHGAKSQRAAEAKGLDTQTYVDQIGRRFQAVWEKLNISYDDFIRTSEPRHKQVVTQVLQALWDQGEIYYAEYEGWYCVSDERFWTEKDLVEGNCPDCGRPVERLVESNYFFRMSAYQDWLIDYIQSHPHFIQPETRKNEVLGFLRQPLNDLCISRPISRLSWGIPLPFDPNYVTYVWFDALLNYITAPGYLADPTRFERLWPSAIHLIGKDILTTHTVYWPTMLKAAGLPLPKTILAHGWWIIEGRKMGKSLGNAIKPLDLAHIYGIDAFRYFLLRDMTLGRDATFSTDNITQRYQSDLANDLGNLLHRVVNMIGRYFDGHLPTPGALTTEEIALQEKGLALVAQVFTLVEKLAVHEALAQTISYIGQINGYLERTAPWRQVKAGQTDQAATTLYTAAEALRLASLLLQPVMPERTVELWRRLGWQPTEPLRAGLAWGELEPDSLVVPGPPLFPREVVEAIA